MTESNEISSEIWTYIEAKMKIVVPPYIKHILKGCGYDNYHSIATIADDDFEYLANEVNQGRVAQMNKDDVMINKDFIWCRGHQKLLIAIVKLVKETLDEGGIDSFSLESSKAKSNKTKTAKPKTLARKTPAVPRKQQQYSYVRLAKNLVDSLCDKDTDDGTHDDSTRKHQLILLKKAVVSIHSVTPGLVEKNKELLKERILSDLVEVLESNANEMLAYTAHISCLYCCKNISVFNNTNDLGEPTFTWNSTNYDRHLKIHKNQVKESIHNEESVAANDDNFKGSEKDDENVSTGTVDETSDTGLSNLAGESSIVSSKAKSSLLLKTGHNNFEPTIEESSITEDTSKKNDENATVVMVDKTFVKTKLSVKSVQESNVKSIVRNLVHYADSEEEAKEEDVIFNSSELNTSIIASGSKAKEHEMMQLKYNNRTTTESDDEPKDEPEFFSRPMTVNDYVLISILNTKDGTSTLKVAKIIQINSKDSDDELEVVFMERTKANSFILPRDKTKESVLKCGVIRVLRRVFTTPKGELQFHDLGRLTNPNINQSSTKRKFCGKKSARSITSKQTVGSGFQSKKQRENGWKY